MRAPPPPVDALEPAAVAGVVPLLGQLDELRRWHVGADRERVEPASKRGAGAAHVEELTRRQRAALRALEAAGHRRLDVARVLRAHALCWAVAATAPVRPQHR